MNSAKCFGMNHPNFWLVLSKWPNEWHEKAVKKDLLDVVELLAYNFDGFICVRDDIRKFYRGLKNKKIAEF